jgi:hypothetical protein
MLQTSISEDASPYGAAPEIDDGNSLRRKRRFSMTCRRDTADLRGMPGRREKRFHPSTALVINAMR